MIRRNLSERHHRTPKSSSFSLLFPFNPCHSLSSPSLCFSRRHRRPALSSSYLPIHFCRLYLWVWDGCFLGLRGGSYLVWVRGLRLVFRMPVVNSPKIRSDQPKTLSQVEESRESTYSNEVCRAPTEYPIGICDAAFPPRNCAP